MYHIYIQRKISKFYEVSLRRKMIHAYRSALMSYSGCCVHVVQLIKLTQWAMRNKRYEVGGQCIWGKWQTQEELAGELGKVYDQNTFNVCMEFPKNQLKTLQLKTVVDISCRCLLGISYILYSSTAKTLIKKLARNSTVQLGSAEEPM